MERHWWAAGAAGLGLLVGLSATSSAPSSDAPATPVATSAETAPRTITLRRSRTDAPVEVTITSHLRLGADRIETRTRCRAEAASPTASDRVLRIDRVTETDAAGERTTRAAPTRSVRVPAGRALPLGRLSPLLRAPLVERRETLRIGQTWTGARRVPVGGSVIVPVQATYTVAGWTRRGTRRLLRLTLVSRGRAETQGLLLTLAGRGELLLDPDDADLPVALRIDYEIEAAGGGSPPVRASTSLALQSRRPDGDA